MRYDTQINVRLDRTVMSELLIAAAAVGSTPSQIAREAILRELKRRKQSTKDKS